MRVFLDSNVILSGIISDKGAPRIILDVLSVRLPLITGLTGEYNIIEIERNLRKKLRSAIPIYEKYLPEINLEIIKLPSVGEIKRYLGHIADKDVPVLVSAINGKSDYLVTGDIKDFEKLKTSADYPFKIISPSEFISGIINKIL
ncbi:MAG: PIN domain-containing protein [Deltaproteobacteria bacterium]|nr:PIN domain-containing protein [Deltaproteobacteria bacterium]